MQLVVNNPQALEVLKTVKNDLTKVTFVSKKEYGTKHDLKGAALTRAHKDYRREFGVSVLNAGISQQMTTGQAVCQSVQETANGFRATFVNAGKLVSKPGKNAPSKADALKLLGITDEQLAALLAAK